MSDPITFKVPLVGDAGVGKSTFMYRHLTGDFLEDYEPTHNYEFKPVIFSTTHGPILHNVWDISASQCTPYERIEHLKGSDGAIIMFDYSCKQTLENVEVWYQELISINGPNIPIAICGSKVDLDEEEHEVTPDLIASCLNMENIQYYDISTRTNHNIECPFFWIMQRVCNDPALEPVFSCGIPPPSFETTEELEKYLDEMREAGALPLPDEDEDLL